MRDIDIESIGEEVPLLEGIRTTRAIRRLRPDPVPPALIRKVCEAGTFAPSGGNRQPWYFIAVTEPERRAWVAERYLPIFRRYIGPAFEAAKDPDFPEAGRRNMRAALHLAEHLHEAPVLLFVAGWRRGGRARPSSPRSRTSCSPAGQWGSALRSPRCTAPSAPSSTAGWASPSRFPAAPCCRSAGRRAATGGPRGARWTRCSASSASTRRGSARSASCASACRRSPARPRTRSSASRHGPESR